jgi:phosphatidylinositol-3-phosphatase
MHRTLLGQKRGRLRLAVLSALPVITLAAAVHAPAAVAAIQQFTRPCGNSGAAGPVHHVIWIWMENEGYDNVLGNPAAPYQNDLAAQCGNAANFHNETHGSLPNYMAATSGNSPLNTALVNDCLPNPVANYCVDPGQSLFEQADGLPGGWRGYAEDMPSSCYRGNVGNYAARHNPAVYYPALSDCATNDVAMGTIGTQTGQFYDDVRAGALPAFSFLTPNQINNSHDSTAAAGDAWLSQLIPFITAGPNYQSGDTTIMITNDEGCAGTCGPDYAVNEDCADPTTSAQLPSCHIPTIVVAPYVPAGTVDNSYYTHYSMLRSTEELLGLPLLGLARNANSMISGFNLGPVVPPATNPPPGTSSVQASAAGPNEVDLSWTAAAPGSTPVAGYAITRNGAPLATVTSATSYRDTAVAPATDYSYTVTAVDSSGASGAASQPVTVTTPPSPPQNPPPNLLGNPGFETGTTGWVTYGPATTLSATTDARTGSSALSVVTTSTSYTSAGASDGSKPTISSTVAGGHYTASCWVKTPAPLTVTLQLKEYTPKWVVPTGTTAATASVKPTDSGWHQLTTGDTAASTGDMVQLSIYSTSAKAGVGFEVDDCSLSDVTASSPDTTPPSVPTSVSADPISSTAITLNWVASTDALGVTGYTVYRDGTQLATPAAAGYTDTGLAAGSTHSYTVTAHDAAGNVSAASIPVSVTTPPLQTNLLANPGFESGTTGWVTYGPNTSLAGVTDAHSGAKALAVSTSNINYTSAGASDGSTPTVSSASAGAAYTATCWVKTTAALTVTLQLKEYTQKWATPAGTTPATTSVKPTDSAWHRLTVGYKAATSGDMLQLSVYTTSMKAGSAGFEVDDCSVVVA